MWRNGGAGGLNVTLQAQPAGPRLCGMNTTAVSARAGQWLRVIQLSDCHVSAAAGVLYRGSDPRKALESMLRAVQAWGPDLILATGDLSEDASEESYRYLSARLSTLDVPVLTTPGNHDLPSLQAAWFEACPVDEPRVHQAGHWQIVLLNSAVEGYVPGLLSDRMLAGLIDALTDREHPKLLVLHHQPVPVGSPWIDRYPLEEPERLWEALDGRSDIRAMVWGHIHQEFAAWHGATRLLGCPSTVINSQPECSEFMPDPRGPACRWIKLGPGGEVATGLLRTPG
jgi:Icc protein